MLGRSFLEDGKGRDSRPMRELIVHLMYVQLKCGLRAVIENGGIVAVKIYTKAPKAKYMGTEFITHKYSVLVGIPFI
jgi:hypothetical protein